MKGRLLWLAAVLLGGLGAILVATDLLHPAVGILIMGTMIAAVFIYAVSTSRPLRE